MKYIFSILFLILVSCGGGSSGTNTSSSSNIIGLQGDMGAIEPLDVD